jgi:hypothetical protein
VESTVSSLAILIDCWDDSSISETAKENHHQFINNIVDFCGNDTEISAIALAGYSKNTEFDLYYEESWIANSNEFFVNETKLDFLRKSWKNIRWDYDSKNHPAIRNMIVPDPKIKFTVFNTYDILYYCNCVNDSIENIYFLGMSWDMCVRDRPVGWLQIASLQYHGFLTKDMTLRTNQKCVFDEFTGSTPDISEPWEATKNSDIFQLNISKIWN